MGVRLTKAPALLTSPSSRPKRSAACWTTRPAVAASLTSPATVQASAPASAIAAATSRASASLRL